MSVVIVGDRRQMKPIIGAEFQNVVSSLEVVSNK